MRRILSAVEVVILFTLLVVLHSPVTRENERAIVVPVPTAPAVLVSSGWQEDFNRLDTVRWKMSPFNVPGNLLGVHQGYWEDKNVKVENGFLVLRLSQDQLSNGLVISRGAAIASREWFGYGTYEVRMRIASTSPSPDGEGEVLSGSVSAAFVYADDSATEIEMAEVEGQSPAKVYLMSWTSPKISQATTVTLSNYRNFHVYKSVWEPGRIEYFVDGVRRSVHQKVVPSTPAHIMISHWGSNNRSFGGPATPGVDRFMYVDWVRYAPLIP